MQGETFVAHAAPAWPVRLYELLRGNDIRTVSYVPDAGHARLISLFDDDPDVTLNMLTSEEEGIAIAAGAWLGGRRSVVLMQSSGVGNCINMLSLTAIMRCPLLMIVTMRGEWAEFNPWQVPMGRAVGPTLEAMGLRVIRVEAEDELLDAVASAATLAFSADQQVAVLLSQRFLGRKKW